MMVSFILSPPVFWTIPKTFLIILFACTPAILLFTYNFIRAEIWRIIYISNSKGKHASAFMNFYIASTVLMMKKDGRYKTEKKRLLKEKIESFQENSDHLWVNFESIWEREINQRRLAKWSRKHLSIDERSDLIYLLVEMAFVDGLFLEKEYQFLTKFSEKMELPLRELKKIIATYKQRLNREEAEREFRHRQKSKTHQKTVKPSKSSKALASEILGVDPNSDDGTIKKAYRKLVKQHHPDRFHGEATAIQEAAKARFIEIQKAYELLIE